MTDGYGCSNGFFGGDGWWVIIIFALIFGWGNGANGFGGYGGGAGSAMNYTLASDFATIQRQLSDGFNSIDNALDRQNSGICDLGYTQAQLINGVNTTILTQANANNVAMLQGFNALGSQFADCCCQNRYDALANANATQNAIQGVRYDMATDTCAITTNASNNARDIIDSQNMGTQAILAKLSQMESNAKDEKIAQLTSANSDLRFQASQIAQNNYLVQQLRPCPVPAYTVPNPYCSCGQTYTGFYNGTTIA